MRNMLINISYFAFKLTCALVRIILLSILVLMTGVSGYAQKQGPALTDSLLRELNSDYFRKKDDSDKVSLLQALSLNYSRSRVDEGIKYGQFSLALAEKIKWKKGIDGAYYCLSTNYLYKGDFKGALTNLLKLKEGTGDKKELLSVYKNIGLSFSELGNFNKSLSYYFKALETAKELDDKTEIARISASISICYEDLGDYTNAKEYLFNAFRLVNSTDVASFYNSIGENSMTVGNSFKALKIKQELENIVTAAAITANDGHVYKDPTDSLKAREDMLKAAITSEYEKKEMSANSEKELSELKEQRRLKEQLLESEFKRITAEAEAKKKFEEEILKNQLEKLGAQSEQARLRLEADKRNTEKINAANLKTERSMRFAAIAFASFLLVIALISYLAYRQKYRANNIIKKLVNEQEHTIEVRTKELEESNEKLSHASRKLVELVQYNAHKMREPLARVMGAMTIMEFLTPEEFCKDITPQINRAVEDLDNSIMQVITLADDTIELYEPSKPKPGTEGSK